MKAFDGIGFMFYYDNLGIAAANQACSEGFRNAEKKSFMETRYEMLDL